MDLAILTAIAKKLSDTAKDGRDDLAPGEYAIDSTVTLHVKGTVTVGTDTEKTPTSSIPVKEVLALFIARAGFTREHSVELLRSCLTDALSKGVEGQGAIEAAADIDSEFKRTVSELTASLPKTPVKGAVKVKCAVVESVPATADSTVAASA